MRNWVSKIGIEFSQIELSWYFLFDKTWNLRKENKKQFWNFLNHLEVQEWLVNKLSKTFGWRCWEGLASHYILFPSESLEWQNAYGCYDANKETKSGKLLRIFRYQVRAVTNLPPLQESRPEVLGLSEEGGVFLTKTSFSLPCGFFLGMVPWLQGPSAEVGGPGGHSLRAWRRRRLPRRHGGGGPQSGRRR